VCGEELEQKGPAQRAGDQQIVSDQVTGEAVDAVGDRGRHHIAHPGGGEPPVTGLA